MNVCDLMTSPAPSVLLNAGIDQTLALMLERPAGSMPVLGANGAVVGILTDAAIRADWGAAFLEANVMPAVTLRGLLANERVMPGTPCCGRGGDGDAQRVRPADPAGYERHPPPEVPRLHGQQCRPRRVTQVFGKAQLRRVRPYERGRVGLCL